jgi:RNA polymerase sigma-70 factor, ECF subfamily
MVTSAAQPSPPCPTARTGPARRAADGEGQTETSGSQADAEEAALARRARDGDRGAFARLYERYAAAVHGVLVSMVSVQEAHDLVQEVFVSALQAIGRLEEPERVGPWLSAIARNRARDALRRRPPAEELDPALEVEAEERETQDDGGEEAARVLGVVRGLPEAYRETLVLRLVEGLSGPEIAARTGMTHGSVRVNLHRGMKILRERLARAGVGWIGA